MPSTSLARRAALGVAGGLPLLAAAVGLAGPAAGAAAAPANATVAVGAGGLVYTGLAGANDITVSLSAGNTRFVISDNGPITAGPGCLPGPKGTFQVFCQVPLNPNGTVRTFQVDSGAGDDRIRNLTAVGMKASGGLGNDVLEGGSASDALFDSRGGDTLRGNAGPDVLDTELSQADGLVDTLDGGSGADDLQAGATADILRGGSGDDTMRGGLGGDTFDGGSGTGDAVAYLDNGHVATDRLVISIDDKPDDGLRALHTTTTQEGDNVLTSVENVFGGHGTDIITGSAADNLLHGNVGDDVISGGLGKDSINGGPGRDQLASNQMFGVPVADGEYDTVNGSSDLDYCRVPIPTLDEQDVTIACEVVDQD
jgi:Ca2+-binding RTX toxin-like protein